MEAWRWTSNPAVQQSRIVTHTGVSFASVSPSSSSSHLRASQPVQPNLSSWQDTSVRTSSGPPQSTNSIAVHVAPVPYDHVTTALLRIPATNFQYQPRFLYILPSLLSFPFRFQGKSGGWVVSKEREETVVRGKRQRSGYDGPIQSVRTSGNEPHFLLTAGNESGPRPIFASKRVFAEKHGEESRFFADRIEFISYL